MGNPRQRESSLTIHFPTLTDPSSNFAAGVAELSHQIRAVQEAAIQWGLGTAEGRALNDQARSLQMRLTSQVTNEPALIGYAAGTTAQTHVESHRVPGGVRASSMAAQATGENPYMRVEISPPANSSALARAGRDAARERILAAPSHQLPGFWERLGTALFGSAQSPREATAPRQPPSIGREALMSQVIRNASAAAVAVTGREYDDSAYQPAVDSVVNRAHQEQMHLAAEVDAGLQRQEFYREASWLDRLLVPDKIANGLIRIGSRVARSD